MRTHLSKHKRQKKRQTQPRHVIGFSKTQGKGDSAFKKGGEKFLAIYSRNYAHTKRSSERFGWQLTGKPTEKRSLKSARHKASTTTRGRKGLRKRLRSQDVGEQLNLSVMIA